MTEQEEKILCDGIETDFSFFVVPNELIDKYLHVMSGAEFKLVMYIIRQTLGYHEKERLITLDEFENGRYDRHGKKINEGLGLSSPTIIQAIKDAIAHGFIVVVEDNKDLSRKKRFYRLRHKGEGEALAPKKKVTKLPKTDDNGKRHKEIFQMLCDYYQWNWQELSSVNKGMLNKITKTLDLAFPQVSPDEMLQAFSVYHQQTGLNVKLKSSDTMQKHILDYINNAVDDIDLSGFKHYADMNCQVCKGKGVVSYGVFCKCKLPRLKEVADYIGDEKKAKIVLDRYKRKKETNHE